MTPQRWRTGLWVLLIVAVVLFGIPALFSWSAFRPAPHTHAPLSEPIVVSAPVLDVRHAEQRIYQLDASQSEARYRVQEVILNTMEGRQVVGVTGDVRGALMIDFATPGASRLGEILIGLDGLASSSRLRDERLRAEYLRTAQYPTARLVAKQMTGLPDTVVVGDTVTLSLEGYLTLKGITALTTWHVTLTLEQDHVVGAAHTEILMSTFGIGPINLIGWLQTEDVVQLQLDFVATAGAEHTAQQPPAHNTRPPEPLTAEVVGAQPVVDFHREIRPILEVSCTGCHTTGQIGHAIFPMVTVGDVLPYTADIADTVLGGYMPPWPPGDDMPPVHYDRSLTDEQLAAIAAWAAGPMTDTTRLDEPLAVVSTNQVQIRADLVLPMPVSYQSPPGITDDYRCFLLDPQLDNARTITGTEVIPGNVSVVHHVLVFPVPATARAAAEAKMGQDDREGWECFGGPGLSGVEGNTAIAPGWVPGAAANKFPPNTGIALNAGDLFVFQVHYNLEAGAQPDLSTLVLELAEPGADMIALQGIGLVAPVEIPCPAHARHTEACQRSTAITDALTRDPQSGLLADAFLVLCDRTLSDYEAQDAAHVVSTCDSAAPIGGQAIQVSGHMHRLGASTRITLNPDSATPQVLLDIPHWDFDWQETYAFVTPIPIAEGDILRLSCTWDNTRQQESARADGAPALAWQNPLAPFGVSSALAHNEVNTSPFRYVTWGEGTRDEMCLGGVIVIPDPAYYNVILSDWDDSWMATILVRVGWMRLMRHPWLVAGIVLGVVVVAVVGLSAYRQAQLARRLRRS